MIKKKVFYGNLENNSYSLKFDNEVNDFIDTVLNNDDCKLIKYNTQIYGKHREYMDCIRTEIIYQITPTRKVLTEKENKDEPRKN